MKSARISSSVGSAVHFQAPISSMTVSAPNFASIARDIEAMNYSFASFRALNAW